MLQFSLLHSAFSPAGIGCVCWKGKEGLTSLLRPGQRERGTERSPPPRAPHSPSVHLQAGRAVPAPVVLLPSPELRLQEWAAGVLRSPFVCGALRLPAFPSSGSLCTACRPPCLPWSRCSSSPRCYWCCCCCRAGLRKRLRGRWCGASPAT